MNNQVSLNRAIRFWLDCTKDNLIAAKTMFKAGRWNLCMFMCQQTVEALLKAVAIIQTKDRPPYIHELGIILRATGIKAPPKIIAILKELDKHYIKSRYREDRFNPKIYNKKSASRILEKTKELLKWFTQEMNLSL